MEYGDGVSKKKSKMVETAMQCNPNPFCTCVSVTTDVQKCLSLDHNVTSCLSLKVL